VYRPRAKQKINVPVGVMDQSSGTRDARYANLSYSIGMMGSDVVTEIYGRPSTSQLQTRTSSAGNAAAGVTSDTTGSIVSGSVNMISQSNTTDNSSISMQRSLKRTSTDICYDDSTNETRQVMPPTQSLISDNTDESFTNLGPPKKSPPSNGKKTKGRVKIKMEYIDNKLRRYTTFSKRKTGIMKKVQ
jgi:serum response factor